MVLLCPRSAHPPVLACLWLSQPCDGVSLRPSGLPGAVTGLSDGGAPSLLQPKGDTTWPGNGHADPAVSSRRHRAEASPRHGDRDGHTGRSVPTGQPGARGGREGRGMCQSRHA